MKSRSLRRGDTVVVDNIEKCHVCEYCRRGMDNLCPDAEIYGQTKPGGFAQYAVIPQAQLFHMPASVRPELAAQTEPLSCVSERHEKNKSHAVAARAAVRRGTDRPDVYQSIETCTV